MVVICLLVLVCHQRTIVLFVWDTVSISIVITEITNTCSNDFSAFSILNNITIVINILLVGVVCIFTVISLPKETVSIFILSGFTSVSDEVLIYILNTYL